MRECRRAQGQRILEEGDREAIGLVGERVRAPHRAVVVGIGLEYSEHAPSVMPACQRVVVTQRAEDNQRTRGAVHAEAPLGAATRERRGSDPP